MQAISMIEMKMAKEKIDWLLCIANVLIDLSKRVACIQNNVSFFRVYQYAWRLAGFRIMPAISTQEVNFHR